MAIRESLLCIAACTIASVVGAPTAEDNVCSSMDCRNLASDISKSIDPLIDPCDDFYQFACGNFLKSDPVLSKQYYHTLMDQTHEDIEKLITTKINRTEPRAFKLVKTMYKSCMHTRWTALSGTQPLRKYLQNLGGWPVVEGDSWNGANFDWRRTIYKFRRDGNRADFISHLGDGIGYLIRFDVERSAEFPFLNIMALHHPGGPWLKEFDEGYFFNNNFVAVYYNAVVNIARMLGANTKRAASEIHEMILFEKKLSKLKLSSAELIELNKHNPVSMADLKQNYPSVPWTTYIRKFVPSSFPVTDATIINVPDPNYYVELEALMATTPKRVQANYVMSRVALRNAVLTTEEMRQNVYRVLDQLDGAFVPVNRRDYCVSEIVDHLSPIVGAMYADKYINNKTRDAVNEVVTSIKQQLDEKLKAFDWSTPAAALSATEQADNLTIFIGYPDNVLNHSKLEELYKNLEFTTSDYFWNMEKLSNHDQELTVKELKISSKENERALLYVPNDGASVTDHHHNTILMAPSKIRGRFFGEDRPKFMNYGAFGNSLAHEIAHVFHKSHYYRKRDMSYPLYWGFVSQPEFDSRAQCLIDQYNSYHVDYTCTKLDGRKTLDENLADAGGIRLAHDAYTKWSANKAEEPKLPGFQQYSAKQMFWIASASTWCAKRTPEDIVATINTDDHTIEKFRVIGMAANTPEFAKDFNCKKTSMMNPAKRCVIWQ